MGDTPERGGLGAAAVPESSGRRRTGGGALAAAHWRRCASAGAGRAVFAGAARARRSAGRRGGRFRARGAGAFLPGGGGKPGAGGLGRVRRTKAAWRGRFAGLSGADARKARRAWGGKAGAAPRCRDAAGGGAGKTAAPSAACVGLRATGGKDGSGVGEKARFRLIRKRFSRGAGFVDSELICPRNLVALVGLLFRRRRVMNVSRRAGRAKSPAGKQNAIQRKEHTP